eukprot:TRINITY_DN6273_c0_g1_i3.p1 TRINITY_DN6273_c0_g1~~TRINITY_DN6273_c0_g1_i3.p1  ORF type:complete len:284 (+),score=48.39 TRINITY_DN6273_c0_g1_i3:538-1389(+)
MTGQAYEFPDFCSQIGTFVGEPLLQTFEADFTTTTATSKVACEIAIMATVRHYFKYVTRCGCGIHFITLKGTHDDWIKVRDKATQLEQFELEWWLSELLPVLDQFVAAAQGTVDKDFWRSIVNMRGASGLNSGPMTGWMQVFFPYLNDGNKIEASGLGAYKESYRGQMNVSHYDTEYGDLFGTAIDMASIPPSLSKAPFLYQDMSTGKEYKMLFMSGITGIVQHADTLAIEPIITWAVLDDVPKTIKPHPAAPKDLDDVPRPHNPMFDVTLKPKASQKSCILS